MSWWVDSRTGCFCAPAEQARLLSEARRLRAALSKRTRTEDANVAP